MLPSGRAKVIYELVVNAVEVLDPLQEALQLQVELVAKVLLRSQLHHHPLPLLLLELHPVAPHPLDFSHPYCLRLLVLSPQLPHQRLQLLYLPLQPQHRLALKAQALQLLRQQLPPVLQLLDLKEVDLADVVAVPAAAEGAHEVHCGLVGVVGTLVHLQFKYITHSMQQYWYNRD